MADRPAAGHSNGGRPAPDLPVAIDGMGGDHAPAEIVSGARQAAAAGHPVLLVGDPERLGDTGDLLGSVNVVGEPGSVPSAAVRS